jgi:hypothetical protein
MVGFTAFVGIEFAIMSIVESMIFQNIEFTPNCMLKSAPASWGVVGYAFGKHYHAMAGTNILILFRALQLSVQATIWMLTLFKDIKNISRIPAAILEASYIFFAMVGMLHIKMKARRVVHGVDFSVLYVGIILSVVKLDPAQFYQCFFPYVKIISRLQLHRLKVFC